MITAVYPGTFDPVTYGHLDIIRRACRMFPRVRVLVAAGHHAKRPLFSLEERLELVRESIRELPQVEVDVLDGLLVAYARKHGVQVVVRGLRAVSDFEYEFQMALTNRKLYSELETVFLMPNEKYTYLSSSLVRELAELEGELSDFVPDFVARKLRERLK
jgi:pantetheine-phosphate adenylyltransferase